MLYICKYLSVFSLEFSDNFIPFMYISTTQVAKYNIYYNVNIVLSSLKLEVIFKV